MDSQHLNAPTSHLETLAVHAGRDRPGPWGSVAPGLFPSSTFERDRDGHLPGGHIYSRTSNPTRQALEEVLAQIEGGVCAAAFASGSAATHAVFQALAPGAQVLAPDDLYHGTKTQLRELFAPWGLGSRFIDMGSLETVAQAITPATRLLWLETPSNPLLKVCDIEAIAALAKRAGALCVVDSTFATPVLQRPLALGADLVVHSTTKYLGGHSDLLGGAVIAAQPSEFFQRVVNVQQAAGAVPSAFDAWLLLRSIATLPLRVRAQVASAQILAEALAAHPRVHTVHYPGLPSHPGYAVARRQMLQPGGMMSIQVRGGRAAAHAVAAAVQLWTRATSLGGVESLIEHRAAVEGPHSTTPDDLLRLSVGLEHPDDLLADLRQALAQL